VNKNTKRVGILVIHCGDTRLASRLASLPAVDLLLATTDMAQAVPLAREHQPDVVVLNEDVPLADGLLMTHRFAHESPGFPVLVFLAESDEKTLADLLDAGASGCALSDIGDKDLTNALQALKRRESYLSPALAKYLIANVQRAIDSTLKKQD